MAATLSTMPPLGSPAPDFTLPDYKGLERSLEDFSAAPALLMIFMCNHCPYVQHVRGEIVRVAADYQPRGLAVVAINANDAERFPEDDIDKMKEYARTYNYTFPYLYDESQETAKAYQAACTPDFFLYDKERKLYYRGRLDDSRPGSDIPVTGANLREALEKVLADRPAPDRQKPSVGCNIKWRPGNEPPYFEK
ncbi:thioredoxin family protein [bacterium]|nr:thioredoxin family protein [candidate division CSSED10-310 bacterium]